MHPQYRFAAFCVVDLMKLELLTHSLTFSGYNSFSMVRRCNL